MTQSISRHFNPHKVLESLDNADEVMETDYTKIHPLFEPIEKFFEFVIVGNAFMMMPDFQEAFKSKIPAMQPLLDKYNKEVGQKIVGSKVHTNIQFYLIYAGRLMAIAIFDFLQSSKYGNYLSNTDIFNFPLDTL